MLKFSKSNFLFAWLCLALLTCPAAAATNPFAAQVHCLTVRQRDQHVWLDARVDYRLSPTAQEALNKGIPLTWLIRVKILELGRVWQTTVFESQVPYRIQFHALLNQYEVKHQETGNGQMFLSFNTALNFMSSLSDLKLMPVADLQARKTYRIAIKAEFNRAILPSPLRPFTYLDSQWFLSSDWSVCSLAN